jgi:hypothetical protein
MGLSIGAFTTPPPLALRASGQLWCSTLAGAMSTASRWDLGHRSYLLRRSFIQFEQPTTITALTSSPLGEIQTVHLVGLSDAVADHSKAKTGNVNDQNLVS